MQEGGISCKKSIGLARSQEYHILGKFVAASIENRDHSDYHDALDIYNNNNSNDPKKNITTTIIIRYRYNNIARP